MRIELFNKGFVELMEVMGDDYSPIENARVSFNGEAYKDESRNEKLLDYLYANNHLSVTESVVLKFRIKLPIFLMRQWIRHRMGSFNERSGRYTEFDEGEYYIPERARVPDKENKQGSKFAETTLLNDYFKGAVIEQSEIAYSEYKKLLSLGIAKECARMILPVNFYTEFIWTVNLRSLMNFLMQRLDNHAQYEIREYSFAISSIFKQILPKNYDMFEKYILKKT